MSRSKTPAAGSGAKTERDRSERGKAGAAAAEVVLADDEPHLRTTCSQALALAGIEAMAFESAQGVIDRLSPDWRGVVVTDVKMPGTGGLELMAAVRALDPEIPVVLITGHGDIAMAVQAMRDGAYDFLEKPFAPERLVETVRRALEKRRLVLENRQLRSALANADPLERALIGRTPAMARLRERIAGFAGADADVLIQGETGSGKELVARGLHELSDRKAGRFVAVNCSALPESVVESELFGHEAGAFTGAQKTRIGKFEFADGGTLFLDEIETMPLDMQVRLLRVLQERRIVRLGSNEERAVDLRVVAATKEDLQALSERGRFRADLFYRLNVLVLKVPPLRERPDDIPLLFEHFVERAALRLRREPVRPSSGEVAQLLAHDWPGNVRELENTAMRFAMGLGVDLGAGEPGAGELGAGGAAPAFGNAALGERMAAVERAILAQTLEDMGGSMRRTYEALGISRKTLYEKLRRHGLRDGGDGDADADHDEED